MLLSLALIPVFLICAVVFWLRGLWNTMLIIVLVLISGLLSLNYYEPLAKMVAEQVPDLQSFLDFIVLWALFLVFLGVLWALRFLLSRQRVEFIMPVELVGRTVVALWCAWLITGFAAMTLHTAPIGANPLGAFDSPSDAKLFFGADRQWLALMQSRSRGALTRWETKEFDPQSEFILKYYHRRSGG